MPDLRAKIARFLPFLAVPPFLVALWAVHHELSAFRYHDIVSAARSVPRASLGAAALLTALNFLVLSGYDGLGLAYVGRTLEWWRWGFASFVGYAFSQALGLPLLTGLPIRLRLYSGWGLTMAEIRDLVVFYSVTLWLGLVVLGGIVFLVEPRAVPAVLHLPVTDARLLGALLLLLGGGYMAWAVAKRAPLRIRSWEVPSPGVRLALPQLIVAVADWVVASSVLYVLLPRGHHVPFFVFVGIFLVAQFAGLASHVPGGVGVFEAIMLVLLPSDVPAGSLAGSLLVYRAIYYLCPLMCAATALGLYEARRKREDIERLADRFGRGVSLIVPQAMAVLTFVAGMVLLFSGATPGEHERLSWLSHVFPLAVIEASHFLASAAGASLLVLAWGIQRRVNTALHMVTALLAAGIVFSLLKGLDWEEAMILTLMLSALVGSRKEFYRRASLLVEPFTPGWTAAIVCAVVAVIGLGIFSYTHVAYSQALWLRFAPHADAARFLRSSAGVLCVILGFAGVRLMRPAAARSAPVTDADSERAATLAHASPYTYAQLVLLGDKQLLMGEHSFVMYGVSGRSWIALGDPVGAAEERRELAWRFHELADRNGGWTVFYQVRPEHLPIYLDLGLTLTKIGEEARVPLADFSVAGGEHRGMRRTLRTMEKHGACFRVVPAEEVPGMLPDLRDISENWLTTKNTREKGFSLGFFNEGYIRRGRVATIEVENEIVAFANIVESAEHEEISVDLMRFSHNAPPSVMEYLFLMAMQRGREEGYRWFNLGMAPLSGLEARPLSPAWTRLGSAVYRHGEHFYHFQGLREYKQKFDPVWEPRYLASPGGLAFPRVLANLAALISGGLRGVLQK